MVISLVSQKPSSLIPLKIRSMADTEDVIPSMAPYTMKGFPGFRAAEIYTRKKKKKKKQTKNKSNQRRTTREKIFKSKKKKKGEEDLGWAP